MAPTPASSIPLPKPKSETREAFQKRVTRALLRYALRKSDTKVIILLGHLRSGKSSLFEDLTGQEGHSANGIDPVTKEYHLGHAYINGEFYLFVDTPGLNETGGNNADILREIGRFLDATKDSVTYAAGPRVGFLEHFCGLEYSPFITFVITLWDECTTTRSMNRHDENATEIKDKKWAPFIERGAAVYYHGRVYEDGEPTHEYLHIKKKKAERRANARDMIGRLYPKDKEYTIPPLIVQELRRHVPLPATSAGKHLQMKYNEVVITNALTYGAGRLDSKGQLALTNPGAIKNAGSGGFDWISSAVSAIIDVVTFPFRLVEGLLTMLWDLIRALGMFIAIIRVTPLRLTDDGVEVLVTLLGDLPVVVGYGRQRGFYWRARDLTESDLTEGGDNEFLNEVLNELRGDGGDVDPDAEFSTEMSEIATPTEDDAESQYRAFGEAFEKARSTTETSAGDQGQGGGGGCTLM
ncbi:uncharacterized protein DSM5745_05802 [Aspergillus mulundensis]|uniref:G domain-containing protein n=1 Tax=Aspergillus mulundensis TaxID=1810919 RepID=A0A3D8RYL6_9EURO|nr:hypothetical protein DSM5745_05802 [Aspergillus mulundensis]RDW78950.1 hypothetical protein DSM5745_05802 [Aspergillus mulundensis]